MLLIEKKNVEENSLVLEFEVHLQQASSDFHLTVAFMSLEFDRDLVWRYTFGSDYNIGIYSKEPRIALRKPI